MKINHIVIPQTESYINNDSTVTNSKSRSSSSSDDKPGHNRCRGTCSSKSQSSSELSTPYKSTGHKRLKLTNTNNNKITPANTTNIQLQYTYYILLLLHPFNGLFSGTTWVSQHKKGKPFWILLEQEMMGWQWHQMP